MFFKNTELWIFEIHYETKWPTIIARKFIEGKQKYDQCSIEY